MGPMESAMTFSEEGPWLTIVSSGRNIQLVNRDVAEAEGWVDSLNNTSPARVFFSGAYRLKSPLQQGLYTSR